MRTLKFLASAVVICGSVFLFSYIECGHSDYANHPQRSLNFASTCQDARTGLCFSYVWRHGSYRTGLSAVPCDHVRESLLWLSGEDERVCGGMRYIRADQTRDPDLCYGYLLDDAGNQKSNLAYVPCEPVLEADVGGRISLERFVP